MTRLVQTHQSSGSQASSEVARGCKTFDILKDTAASLGSGVVSFVVINSSVNDFNALVTLSVAEFDIELNVPRIYGF